MNRLNRGDLVVYEDGHGRKEFGIVSSVKEGFAAGNTAHVRYFRTQANSESTDTKDLRKVSDFRAFLNELDGNPDPPKDKELFEDYIVQEIHSD